MTSPTPEPAHLDAGKPTARQIVFNWTMGETDLSKRGGWWGTQDEVDRIDELLTALREAARPEPIPMVLHCPKCGLQHIDGADPKSSMLTDEEAAHNGLWSNPPHCSHLCHGCGHIWRPADVPTTGVAAVQTRGKADEALVGCPHEWCMTILSTTAGDRQGVRCAKCGVTRDIDKRPSPTQGDEGALREAAKGIKAAWEGLPEGIHTSQTIQVWLVQEMKPAMDSLRAALSTRPTPPDRGDEAAFEEAPCGLCDSAGRCTFACESAESVPPPSAGQLLGLARQVLDELARPDGEPKKGDATRLREACGRLRDEIAAFLAARSPSDAGGV